METVEPEVAEEQPATSTAQTEAGGETEDVDDLPAPVTSLEADDYLRERYEGDNGITGFLGADCTASWSHIGGKCSGFHCCGQP